ncbi:hypothetical protein [uncultured Aquimarina sp.]|uniref:hypothetical protein n=1 Tax=uncultured Aquimarina sp. TaxID=575652 RepID=UPI00260FF204|nr:hypothetical protein [uncultured Aquimarina sp.]
MKLPTIKEVDRQLSPFQMVENILNDFRITHGTFLDVTKSSSENGDSATEEMATIFIKGLEKRL